LLVPVETAKRKSPNFLRTVKTGDNGEFEVKAAPNEYAIVFYNKEFYTKKGSELEQWLDEAVKNAQKITIKAKETSKISLTLPTK
jgi:hypothetical protein